MAKADLTSTSEAAAAFESYIDESGAFSDLVDAEHTEQTPEDRQDEEDETTDDQEPDDQTQDDQLGDTDEDASGDEQDPSDQEEEQGDDSDDISTLDSLAGYFEVEPDEVLDSIMVEAPDGAEVSIGDALNSWRESEASVGVRRTELENDFATARSEYDAQATEATQRLAGMAQVMIDEMKESYSPEKLQYLKESNPEEYVELMERKHVLDEKIRGAIDGINQESSRQQSHSKEDMERLLTQENQRLVERIPEWKDSGVRQDAMAKATRYLIDECKFTQKDVDSITDHRLLYLARDAMAGYRLRKGVDSKNVDTQKKKGLKKPSPGLRGRTRRDPENPKNRDRESAKTRLHQKGDVKDAAKMMEDFI